MPLQFTVCNHKSSWILPESKSDAESGVGRYVCAATYAAAPTLAMLSCLGKLYFLSLQALLAWYKDTLAAHSEQEVSPSKPPATPFSKLSLATPAKATRGRQAALHVNDETSPGTAVTSPLARLGLKTTQAKGRAPADSATVSMSAVIAKAKSCWPEDH